MTEKYILGQRALAKSKGKIGCLLNTWDYEKHGEPTPEKLSKLIPMGIDTVKKHIVDFRSKIDKINTTEQERLNRLKEREQFMRDWLANYKLKQASQSEKNNNEIDG